MVRKEQSQEEKVILRIAPLGQAGEIPTAPTQTAIAGTLINALEGPGEVTVEPIRLGTVMKANLTGDGFDISLLSEEEQFVSDDTYTEWIWNVIPLKPGEQELYLRVSVKVIVERLGERTRDIDVITRMVVVEVDPVYTTKSFLVNNWKWIVAVAGLLFPFFGWGWREYSKKQAEKQEKIEQNRQYFE